MKGGGYEKNNLQMLMDCHFLGIQTNILVYSYRLLESLFCLHVVEVGGDGNVVIGPPAPTGLTYTGVTSQAVID